MVIVNKSIEQFFLVNIEFKKHFICADDFNFVKFYIKMFFKLFNHLRIFCHFAFTVNRKSVF